MNIHQKGRIFFTHAITILSLFTYSVCDEKVKNYQLRILASYFFCFFFWFPKLQDVKVSPGKFRLAVRGCWFFHCKDP